MKPLGKSMKIGNMQNFPEEETLSVFLTSYRDIPLVSTGVPPAHMLFRDGCRNNLPTNRLQTTKLDKLEKEIVT